MTYHFHRIKSYLSYWLNAVGEHSLQGPFIYDLHKKVIKNKQPDYTEIDQVREQFIKSNDLINLEGFGAGSSYDKSKSRPVSDIAKKGIINKKQGAILSQLVDYIEAKNVLELGTSLGISTLYLSQNSTTNVTTIEGEHELAIHAKSVFSELGRSNISLINGDIDKILQEYLQKSAPLDLVFFDANHTQEATLRYFQQCLKKKHDKSCFVFDDIHWSPGMENAWKEIYQHFEVTLSIDLFQMGIIFFNPEIRKQHFILET